MFFEFQRIKMAKNQKHVDKLKAKLKATLNQKSNSNGVTTPKPAPVAAAAVYSTAKPATATTATTANKSSVNPNIQKVNKKSTEKLNGAAVAPNVQSQTTKKSAQPKQKQQPKVASNKIVEAAAPKLNPIEIPKKKPNIILNKVKQNEPNQSIKTEKKMKKKKEKKRKPNATVPVKTKQPHENQPIQEGKRKFDEVKTNKNIQAKRLKCDRNGFIERNIDSDEEIKVPNGKKPPKKIKQKKVKKGQTKIVEINSSSEEEVAAGPPVTVIDVDEDQLNGSDDHSDSGADSEADSYIDRFFQGDKNEFNENRIYSVDEIETENQHFLAKASGVRTNSDDDTSSSEGIHAYGSDSDSDSNSDSNSDASDSIIETESSKGRKKHTSNELEEYTWSSGEDVDDSDYDDYDDDDDDMNGGMYYGSDSEVSLGSAVDSDDLDDTYEDESMDSSMEGYEMNSSYEDDSDDDEDGHSECDDSDHSNYSYSESHSSQDTYDEFLHRRHYDSSNDDQDYNGELLQNEIV